MNALLWADENPEPSHNTLRALMECGGKAKQRPRFGFEQWTVDLFGSCIQPKRRRRYALPAHSIALARVLRHATLLVAAVSRYTRLPGQIDYDVDKEECQFYHVDS